MGVVVSYAGRVFDNKPLLSCLERYEVMKCRCLWLLFLCFLASAAYGEVYNGGFEEFYEPNETLGFSPPVGWGHENYTAVDCNFVPDPYPRPGGSQHWKIDVLEPSEGERFLILSTAHVTPGPAKVWQEVSFYAGQKLYGVYFFGTYDYPNYLDIGRVELTEPNNHDNILISIVSVGVADVLQFGSMEGWKTFEHVFTEDGTYDLVLSVDDVGDEAYDSFFMVDGIDVCWAPEYGDVNMDCHVNLEDFGLFANDWLLYDPNYTSDPNFIAENENTDIDGSHFRDENDLFLMSEYWLHDPNEEP